MGVLTHLEPTRVFYYFEEITKIPHGSGNTKEISDFLAAFARENNLKYRQDELNNIVIWKEGKGKPVILQGHMDMVCEKEPDCNKDMSKEGLDIYVDGGEVRAKGTTLGGDNGIAVAMAMALLELEDDTLPPIEAIITVDEETGMYGAAGLDPNGIEGRLMLNLDSEDEGVFTVSCAGGIRAGLEVDITRDNPLSYDKASNDFMADGAGSSKMANNVSLVAAIYEIEVKGLIGGHSGIKIHKNRGNAIHLLGRALQGIRDEADIRLITVSGGAKDNAIAVAAKARLALLSKGDNAEEVKTDFINTLKALEADFKGEYATTDREVNISCEELFENTITPMDRESTDKVIYMLCCTPNGVMKMSPDVAGLVQTSLNKGILTTVNKATGEMDANGDKVIMTLALRSSVASEKEALKKQLRDMMAAIGGSSDFKGDYPGWQYLVESPLRDLISEVFKDNYGYEPKVEAIHAGVECGYFAEKLPGLDCVSLGPNLREIHTPRESMDIASVERTYKLVLETLRRLAL